MQAVGQIIAAYEDIKTGRIDKVLEQKNLILFEGADIMSALLGGKPGYSISHMYFQYQNSASLPVIVNPITRADGRAIFTSISGGGGEDWLRVPLITESKLVKVPDDTTDFNQNGVWFTGTTAASPSYIGESPAHNPFQSTSPFSWVYSLALVASPNHGDPTKDLVFSRVNLSTPLQLPAGKHLVFFWLIKFQ